MEGDQNSPVNELLRYMLIVDMERLADLEQEYGGAIRIGPVGRYGCRLLVRGIMVEFALRTLQDNTENFLVMENGKNRKPSTSPISERLLSLVKHRAAETMIGVRAGHHEYNQRRPKKSGHKKKKRAGY